MTPEEWFDKAKESKEEIFRLKKIPLSEKKQLKICDFIVKNFEILMDEKIDKIRALDNKTWEECVELWNFFILVLEKIEVDVVEIKGFTKIKDYKPSRPPLGLKI